jgi:hypothetical protein
MSRKFLDNTELDDLKAFANEIYGEDDEKSAALAERINEYLTGRYANMNTASRNGVYSLSPDGKLRKH